LTPVNRALAWLDEHGWCGDIVERRITPIVCKDFFSCIDIIAIDRMSSRTLAVQVCHISDIYKRRAKVRASGKLELMLEAGWQVWVMGWNSSEIPKVLSLSAEPA